MRIEQKIAFWLIFILSCTAYAQQTKKPMPGSQTLEGTVVGLDGTKYWTGFKIESGGKQYTFVTKYNAKQGTNPTIAGGKCCEIGTRLRVTFKGSPNRYLLDVTHIVILSPASDSQFMPAEGGVILVPVPAPAPTNIGPRPMQMPPLHITPSGPQMTAEESFFYKIAIQRKADTKAKDGVSDDADVYAKMFDNANYKRAMADEFERSRYLARLRAKVEDGLRRVDFNGLFSSIVMANIGEYDFESHSFPVTLIPDAITGVNENYFTWLLPMSEIEANAFVKSRSVSNRGSVDRSIALRITYSIVNVKPPWSGFLYFFHSIEAFSDEKLTRRLGVIPKLSLPGPSTSEEWRIARLAAQAGTGAIRKNSIGMEMVYIRPGVFLTGTKNQYGLMQTSSPVHNVTISSGFWMAKYEVTQGQWESVMGTTVKQQGDKVGRASAIRGEGAAWPMYYVNWEEANEFVRRMNSKNDGFQYSLPTEAQWEYAARAGRTEDLPGNPDTIAWYSANSEGESHPVGTKLPNDWGLHDMHGNVIEWCQDWDSWYTRSPATDPRGPGSGKTKMARGGSFFSSGNGDLAMTGRYFLEPDKRTVELGFRIVARSTSLENAPRLEMGQSTPGEESDIGIWSSSTYRKRQ